MDQATFDEVVDRLTAAEPAGVRMTSLLVSGAGETFAHHFTGRRSPPTDIRSISKVVVSLAVGAAIADGVRLRGRPLSPDLPVWPCFAGFLGRQTATGRENLRNVRLRHLLTNTTGFDEGFLFRDDLHGRDRNALLPYIFAHELVHPPGSHFAYSNVGWYLISVMVAEELGTTLSDFVSAHVLDKLAITDFTWVRYGRYEAAATGLSLAAGDLQKIGELLLDDGRYRGRQVIPRTWVEAMRSPAVRVSGEYDPGSPLRATAYGYGLWIGDGGVFYCDGTGGQFLIVVPRTRTIVVALAESGDTLTVSRCLRDAL